MFLGLNGVVVKSHGSATAKGVAHAVAVAARLLENNLTQGAFTANRLETLQLLSSQAAISIEKAQLFQGLEEAHTSLKDYSENLEQKVDGEMKSISV